MPSNFVKRPLPPHAASTRRHQPQSHAKLPSRTRARNKDARTRRLIEAIVRITSVMLTIAFDTVLAYCVKTVLYAVYAVYAAV